MNCTGQGRGCTDCTTGVVVQDRDCTGQDCAGKWLCSTGIVQHGRFYRVTVFRISPQFSRHTVPVLSWLDLSIQFSHQLRLPRLGSQASPHQEGSWFVAGGCCPSTAWWEPATCGLAVELFRYKYFFLSNQKRPGLSGSLLMKLTPTQSKM